MNRKRVWAEQFYNSSAWRRCRADYLFSVGGMCETCWKEDGLIEVEHIEVHHKIKLTPDNVSDPSVSLNWNNLIALCKKHHYQLHHEQVKRYDVDAFGRIEL